MAPSENEFDIPVLCINSLSKTNEVDTIIIVVTLPVKKMAQKD